MAKVEVACENCGTKIMRCPSQILRHIFCSRECSRSFRSERMSEYNRTKNPQNTSAGWSNENREAVRDRERINKGECKPGTYPKYHGRHEHRVVAEEMLGRALAPGEVVHHIDGNKHNNSPNNLMVFSSQAEHALYHAKERGGDVNGSHQ